MPLMHPRSKYWHLIDYVITKRRDRRDVRVTKAMCGADCWTHHCPILSKLNLRVLPRRRPQGMKAPKRVHQSFADTLDERLEPTTLDTHDVDAAWDTLREAVYNTATECLGLCTRKHKDWFDENCSEIKQLLEEKNHTYKAHVNDPKSRAKSDALRSIRSTIQQKLRQMQDSWQREPTSSRQPPRHLPALHRRQNSGQSPT